MSGGRRDRVARDDAYRGVVRRADPSRPRRRRQFVLALSVVIALALVLACLGAVWRGNDARSGAPQPGGPGLGSTPPPTQSEALGPVPRPVLDGGWFQLYFTAPVYPDDPAGHQGGLDRALVALIDSATASLDIAVYDFDSRTIALAIARARSRGVAVRMVTDSDTLNDRRNGPTQAALATVRDAGVPIVGDGRGAIMHHKFTVVDRARVATGSWNYTDGDTYRLNNNTIVIQSPELAANFTAEFEKMFVLKQFGPNKNRGGTDPVLAAHGTRIENYFAPQDGVADRIVSAIGAARSSIRFLAFSFTSDAIAAAMLERRSAGVALSGVFETTGSKTQYSEFTRMKGAGVEVYQDGSPWAMHHKVIIIDDRIVIFGSYNFSNNANTQNDENLLIIDNADIARAFVQEYDRIVTLARNPPARR